MSGKPQIIFLDMDEVFVDFCSEACKLFGYSREEFEKKRIPGHWQMADSLGISQEEFWKPIHDAGADFWLSLKPLPWADDIISLVRSLGLEWHVVTGPSPCHTSYDGKVKWLKNYFGNSFDNFVITLHKHILAGPEALLIDDSKQNCTDFRSGKGKRLGGSAILFPSYGNELNYIADDPVTYVRNHSCISSFVT